MTILIFVLTIIWNVAADKAIDYAAEKVVSEYHEYKEQKENEKAGP